MKTVVLVLYLTSTIWALLSIILHGSRPIKSISWVLTILVFPFAGCILYYLFGVNRRKFKLFKLSQTEKRKLYNFEHSDKKDVDFTTVFPYSRDQKLSRLLYKNSLMKPFLGNKVEVLEDGEETFSSIFKEIEKAKRFVHLQYFIIEDGEIVEKLYQIFKSKIQEGVEVRMLFDYIGSFSLVGKAIKRFKDIGVKAYPIMPLKYGNLLFTLNYRNHRKLLIVDGLVGFIGGVNITDKYLDKSSYLGVWKDLHLRIEGPIVNSLHKIFIKDYHFAGKEDLLLNEYYLPPSDKKGNTTAQLVASGPDSMYPSIMQQYLGMIHLAEKSIAIANPYFIPGRAVMEALRIASLSGIKVRLLVPRKTDSILASFSTFSHFEELLECGVQIYVRSDFSHSKFLLIDEELFSVGSGNFDYRSFEHNFEANAVVYDSGLAKNLSKKFTDLCSKADQLVYETYKERSRLRKFWEGLARFFSPLL